MSKLQALADKLNEAKSAMKRDGEEALKEAFSEFFSKHPEASAIVWCQYTPYFNDGDPCEFRVNEAELKVDADKMAVDVAKFFKEDEGDDENYHHGDGCAVNALEMVSSTKYSFYDDYRKERDVIQRNLTRSEQSLVDDFTALAKQLDSLDDMLQTVLGDHILVTVTPEGIETSDYEHD
jgi:hypothetical protein